jgi:voltage-gated potassium channel
MRIRMSVHHHRPPPPPPSKARLLLQLLGRRLRVIGSIYVVVFFVAALAMYLAEHGKPDSKFTSIGDSIWYCVVTLSTVGYGDVYPVTTAGRVVAGVFILFTLTTIGFLLTAFNEGVLEVKRMEEHGLIPTAMKNHVIVCGFGPLVRVALAELVAADREVAVIVERTEDIEVARQWAHGGAFITAGEATQEVLRERMNALAADTAVVASADDTLNMITALNLRALNPKMRIVVALQREELRQTLRASGVTYVASPNELSGRLVASAAFEPEVAHFVEDVTSGADEDGHDLQQFPATPLAGRTVAEIRSELEGLDGPLLVAVAQKDGNEYKVLAHPARTLKVAADDYLIVLTNEAQADRFSSKFQLKQGR